jgi:hypothetical protein
MSHLAAAGAAICPDNSPAPQAAETFDRVLGDVFAVQEEIARLLADAVQRPLFGRDATRGYYPADLQFCGGMPLDSESRTA